MKTKTRKNTLMESQTYRAAYDMLMERMIIHHPEHGRLLLSEGFGGMDQIRGGSYRYEHGTACKIRETDTLESLGFDGFDLMPEDWSGKIVSKIAESVTG